MAISDLTDKQVASVIQRYRERGETEGGPYSLAELLLEQRRRTPTDFPVVETAKIIIEKSKHSADGLVTYLDLWEHFRPGEPWKGHGSQRITAKALFRVIAYCVDHGLPILTVLVVQKQSRSLSTEAIANIYNECRELGLEVGTDPTAFVRSQVQLSRSLTQHDLPDE